VPTQAFFNDDMGGAQFWRNSGAILAQFWRNL